MVLSRSWFTGFVWFIVNACVGVHAQEQPRRISIETVREQIPSEPQVDTELESNNFKNAVSAPKPSRESTAEEKPQADVVDDGDVAGMLSPEDNEELIADPSEVTNRKVYQLNNWADKNFVKPTARGYKKYVPEGVRLCAGNAFENIGTPYTAINNLLQGKIKATCQDVGRFVLNSTLGVGGCVDVASQWGIPKHEEDFGQTLAVWGVKSGRFVMLPGFGPSTVRDTFGRAVDMIASPLNYIGNARIRYSVTGYKLLDTRTGLLDASDIVDETAIDPYIMIRDGWMQSRISQIKDEDGSYDGGSKNSDGQPGSNLPPGGQRKVQ